METKEINWEELFEKVGLTRERVAVKLMNLILHNTEADVCLSAIGKYHRLLDYSQQDLIIDNINERSLDEYWVKSCKWKYGVDLHHIDKNPSNNLKENLIYLCPNHHYLHHRKYILLNDLHKFQ